LTKIKKNKENKEEGNQNEWDEKMKEDKRRKNQNFGNIKSRSNIWNKWFKLNYELKSKITMEKKIKIEAKRTGKIIS